MSALQKASDLLEVVDWAATECVNASADHPLENALKQGYREDAQLRLESDADEQLLVHLNFTTAVRVHSIALQGPADGHAPKDVRLFRNRPTIGFTEAEDDAPEQAFSLSAEDVTSCKAVALRLPKFQGTNTLSIFIASNQGDEETTHVSKLVVSGMSVQGMNVADIKKGEEG